MNDLEASADDEGPSEKAFHLFRCGVCCHIEIFRLESQQQIPYRAADNKCLIAGIVQYTDNPYGTVGYQTRIDAVLCGIQGNRFIGGTGIRTHAKNLADQFVNHRIIAIKASLSFRHMLSDDCWD